MNWRRVCSMFVFALAVTAVIFLAVQNLEFAIPFAIFAIPWIGCVCYQFAQDGPKSTAMFSIVALILYHITLWPKIQRARQTGYAYPFESFFEVFNEIAGICFIVFWFVFGVSAALRKPQPNRTLGQLSLLCLLSPFVLFFLHCWERYFKLLEIISPDAPDFIRAITDAIWEW